MRATAPSTGSAQQSQEESQEQGTQCSGEFIPFTRTAVEQSIPDRFEEQVVACGQKTAVKTSGHGLTYEELNRTANQVAQGILKRLGDTEMPIAILLEQGASLIATILGALKAGKMYVPLDPAYPQTRTSYAFRDSAAPLILTNSRNLHLAGELSDDTQPIINVDDLDSGLSTESPNLSIAPDRLAFLLYTSGSTGQPKGVAHSHRNLLHEIMNYTNGLEISSQDRIVLLSSCSFVDSVRATYGALLNGATLCPFDIKKEGLANLAAWLTGQEITIARFVPTVFRHFCSVLSGYERFPSMRLINLSGEPVESRDVELARKHFSPDCVVVNSLGSTETMTYRWNFIHSDLPIKGINVPVGYAVQDMEVLLWDDSGNGVGFDTIGEIAVKSSYLTPGYWESPTATRTRFLDDPEGTDQRIYLTGDLGSMSSDGCLVHQGRKDFQVKIRGFRVELGEVESVLRQIPGVREAAALLMRRTPDDRRLVAYVVPDGGTALTPKKLHGYLEEELPDYMLPTAYVVLKALPLTPNSKLDRQALPPPDWAEYEREEAYVGPRTPVEELLAGIFGLLLNLERIGIHDSFFELGGNSLSAMRALSRVQESLSIQLPLVTIFERPTVASLADAVESARAAGHGEGVPPTPRASWELRRIKTSSDGTLVLDDDTKKGPGDRE